jgi:hypothetical protein
VMQGVVIGEMKKIKMIRCFVKESRQTWAAHKYTSSNPTGRKQTQNPNNQSNPKQTKQVLLS